MAFRLARVLRLRAQLRARAQDEVAKARGALATVHEAIATARAAQDRAHAEEAASPGASVTATEFLRFRAFASAMRAREAALERRRTRLAEALVVRRQALGARRRDERQLEMLRERARERDVAAAGRGTTALLDDLARRRRLGRR